MRMLVRPQGLNPGSTAVEGGHDHFTDLAGSHRIAGPGPHDLHDGTLIHDHALERRTFIGDDAEVGGGICLIGVDTALLVLGTQGREQRSAADQFFRK